MKAHVLTGSKAEIAESMARIEGDIREVIVLVDEPTEVVGSPAQDIFAEMEPFTVKAGGADYSREKLYTRQGDE